MQRPPAEGHRRRPGFGAGMRAFAEAFALFARAPSLWPWALVPVLVFVVLEGSFTALAVFIARPWLAERLPDATTWYGRVGVGVASWGVAVAIVLVGWLVAVALAPPLSAPALERIVERVEAELGLPPREPIGFFRELLCGFRALAGAAILGIPTLGLLWLVSLLFPPAAVLTVPLKIAVSSLLVAWGLFDYPLTLRGVGFRRRLTLVRENFACALGFGAVFTLLFWFPCCGLALLPIGVAAATRVVAEIEGLV